MGRQAGSQHASDAASAGMRSAAALRRPEPETTVLALVAASDVSGPCRGLFQLIEQTKDAGVRFVLGMFLVAQHRTTPAIEEARRRGFLVEVLAQRSRYDLGLVRQTWHLLHRYRPAIIQSHGYKSALLCCLVRPLSRLPWVAFSHGYTNENYRITLYNRLDRALLKRADRIVAVSDVMRRALVTSGVKPTRVRVVPNAVEAQEPRTVSDGHAWRRSQDVMSDVPLVGVVGRLSPEKGHAVFIEAFREVVASRPSAQAVFVGDGPARPALESLVRRAGLTAHIRFIGYYLDISMVYAALDLLVIPSWSEGLPNVLLEAMAHRKAIVATAVGGIPEVMRPAGLRWLVPAGDSPRLADAMLEALGDAELRAALGHAGEAYVRQAFSPAHRAARMLAVYAELTQKWTATPPTT